MCPSLLTDENHDRFNTNFSRCFSSNTTHTDPCEQLPLSHQKNSDYDPLTCVFTKSQTKLKQIITKVTNHKPLTLFSLFPELGQNHTLKHVGQEVTQQDEVWYSYPGPIRVLLPMMQFQPSLHDEISLNFLYFILLSFPFFYSLLLSFLLLPYSISICITFLQKYYLDMFINHLTSFISPDSMFIPPPHLFLQTMAKYASHHFTSGHSAPLKANISLRA